MKYQKLFRQGIAVALTTSMLLTGCASGNADNTNADVEQKTETENGTEESLKTEEKTSGDSETGKTDDDLVEELKKKYSGAGIGEYDGNVIKVKRDESIQIELGYNPWESDQKIYESFEIYQDAELKFPVEAGYYDYDANSGMLTITPPFYGVAEIDSNEVDLSHLSGNYLADQDDYGWGTLSQYYLVSNVDAGTGEPLDKPVITVIQVESEIKQAPQLVFDQTEDGFARFSWKEVPGAEGYLLFMIRKDEEGFWGYTNVFADVKGTEWTSREDSSWEDEILSLNYRFRQYYTSEDSQQWIDDTDSFLKDYTIEEDYDAYFSEYYGLVAYNSKGCSHASNFLSAKDLSHMLPIEQASYGNEESFFGIEGVLDLPAVMCVTMCDGSTAQKVIEYDFVNMKKDEEYNCLRISGKGLQTPFNFDFSAYDVDWSTFDQDIETIKKRQEELKNKGGNVAPSLTVEDATDTEKPEETKPEETQEEEPKTEGTETQSSSEQQPKEKIETTVYANSAMSEYIATKMLETKKSIDISAFPESADTAKVVDAFFEAQYQNPLILGVRGGSIDPENRVLYVEYDYDRKTTEGKQQEIREKVSKITDEIIEDGMSDAQKELAINTYLCENSQYDHDALKNAEKYSFTMVDEEFYDSFTAYGILIDGVGVCASYSAAFKLLADAAGMESIVVTGYLDGSVPHAWNKVKVDDHWYIVDATNNDNDTIDNALLNLSDSAAYGTLVENDSFVMDDSLYDYAADTDDLEYYHTIGRYFGKEQVAEELASLLAEDGQAVLRTDYDIDDEEFYDIAQQVADKAQKSITGFYWMGVVHLEE